mmetsp:Transcript_6478/g.18544  ORF Transcript_6478/g.18544 Transcript_6478/m.18544 type:complete len:260 (-) Transcript_6478:381-1160(-)
MRVVGLLPREGQRVVGNLQRLLPCLAGLRADVRGALGERREELAVGDEEGEVALVLPALRLPEEGLASPSRSHGLVVVLHRDLRIRQQVEGASLGSFVLLFLEDLLRLARHRQGALRIALAALAGQRAAQRQQRHALLQPVLLLPCGVPRVRGCSDRIPPLAEVHADVAEAAVGTDQGVGILDLFEDLQGRLEVLLGFFCLAGRELHVAPRVEQRGLELPAAPCRLRQASDDGEGPVRCPQCLRVVLGGDVDGDKSLDG